MESNSATTTMIKISPTIHPSLQKYIVHKLTQQQQKLFTLYNSNLNPFNEQNEISTIFMISDYYDQTPLNENQNEITLNYENYRSLLWLLDCLEQNQVFSAGVDVLYKVPKQQITHDLIDSYQKLTVKIDINDENLLNQVQVLDELFKQTLQDIENEEQKNQQEIHHNKKDSIVIINDQEFQQITNHTKQSYKDKYIVNHYWLLDSYIAGELLNYRNYLIQDKTQISEDLIFEKQNLDVAMNDFEQEQQNLQENCHNPAQQQETDDFSKLLSMVDDDLEDQINSKSQQNIEEEVKDTNLGFSQIDKQMQDLTVNSVDQLSQPIITQDQDIKKQSQTSQQLNAYEKLEYLHNILKDESIASHDQLFHKQIQNISEYLICEDNSEIIFVISKGTSSDRSLKLIESKINKFCESFDLLPLIYYDFKSLKGENLLQDPSQNQCQKLILMLVLDDFKRTEKTLIAISMGIPIIKKAFLDLDPLQDLQEQLEKQSCNYFWLEDGKVFNRRSISSFTKDQIWKYSQSKWEIYRQKKELLINIRVNINVANKNTTDLISRICQIVNFKTQECCVDNEVDSCICDIDNCIQIEVNDQEQVIEPNCDQCTVILSSKRFYDLITLN
eukprot:403331576